MDKHENTTWNDEDVSKFDAKKKWKLVGNVLKATHLFKNHEIKVVDDLDQLVREVKDSPSRHDKGKRVTFTSECIYEHKISEKLFFHIRRSNSEDLTQITELIETNPRRFTRTLKDPDSFINKANHEGFRPLYEACKNGYYQTVQLLINQGADPHLLSTTNKENESNLEVSCRWGHLAVVRCLLINSTWTNKELKAAFKLSQNEEIKKMLKDNMSPSKSICCCFK